MKVGGKRRFFLPSTYFPSAYPPSAFLPTVPNSILAYGCLPEYFQALLNRFCKATCRRALRFLFFLCAFVPSWLVLFSPQKFFTTENTKI
ncbi:MAG: hypothetical protein V2A53_02765 [bacterium]